MCGDVGDLTLDSDLVMGEVTGSSSSVEPSQVTNADHVDPGEVLFNPPVSSKGRVVEIFYDCTMGTCDYQNLVGSVHCNLRPCRVGGFLFDGNCSLPAEEVRMIWDGLCDGFSLVDEGFSSSYECENYSSITDQKFCSEMSGLLSKELSEGKVSLCDVKPTCIHSKGAVPKSDGRLRHITDCSLPKGRSVNNFMLTTCKSFKYKSVNDVAKDLCEGDYMSVVDISSAYRSVPISPDHSTFLSFKWDFGDGRGELYLQENRLSFGLKCTPYIFDMLSNLAVDMSGYEGAQRVVNYVDDYIVVDGTFGGCASGQKILVSVLRRMGFEIAWKKGSSPATKTTFLGICIDSVKMNLSLPEDKIVKLMSLIEELQGARRATKKQLERLAGLLAHFSSVIRGGRTFCRRVYDLFATCRKGSSVALSEEIRLDLSWWRSFNSGHDKSFSNVVARRATIQPFLVARPKRLLPRIY